MLFSRTDSSHRRPCGRLDEEEKEKRRLFLRGRRASDCLLVDGGSLREHRAASGVLVGPQPCGTHVAFIVQLKRLGEWVTMNLCTEQLSVPHQRFFLSPLL